MQRILILVVISLSTAACTPYRSAIVNDLGASTSIILYRTNGTELRGVIPNERRLMLYDDISSLNSVNYSGGHQECRLTSTDLAARARKEGDINIVRLAPCIDARRTQTEN